MRVLTLEVGGRPLRVGVPEGHRERMRGLRDPAAAELDGLLFHRTRSIQTLGMHRAIVVVALDRDLRILAVREVAPGRVLLPRRGVRHLVELRERLPELDRGERVGGYTVAAAPGEVGSDAREA